MEPTIYNPSIYKTPGVYKTGAEGGGSEFETYGPNYDTPVTLGGKTYQTIKIGSLVWLAENLDYRWAGLSSNMMDGSSGVAAATYYDDDETTYGANGLIYNGYAREELKTLLANGLLPGWRIPTQTDFTFLAQGFVTNYLNPFYGSKNIVFETNNVVCNLKSSTDWDGKNSFGFNLKRCGYFSSYINFHWEGITLYTCVWAARNDTVACHYDWGNDKYLVNGSTVNDNKFGCVIRLVKDAL